MMVPSMLAFTGAGMVATLRLCALATQCLLLLQGALLLHRIQIVAEQSLRALGVIPVGAVAALWTLTVATRAAVPVAVTVATGLAIVTAASVSAGLTVVTTFAIAARAAVVTALTVATRLAVVAALTVTTSRLAIETAIPLTLTRAATV